MVKETDIVNSILDYLTLKHCLAFRVNTMGNFSPKSGGYYKNPRLKIGVPDIIMVLKGKFIGIEVKRPKGKQSEGQKQFQKELEQAGGEYLLVYSLEEIIKKYEELKPSD